MKRLAFSVPMLAFLFLLSPARAKAQAPKLTPNSADEPLARAFSLARSAAVLDNQSLAWTQQRKCGTCHTNYPYLLARPLLKGDTAALTEVRTFFEKRIANWDSGKKEDKPRWDTEVVATGATLAIQDALTTGKLHPLTRQALDRIWKLQQPEGAWNWLKCNWPPTEHDDYYGAVYAALGVGYAPDHYAQTDQAKAGLEKLRRYFKNNPPPSLHHKAMLLWASLRVERLMSDNLRKSTVKELLAAQRADGGWSLPTLGDWTGRDERPNDRLAPSDGYATGLTIYVLRQAGVPVAHEQIQKGVAWLKQNQRESGRWFTRSLNTDNYHFITHAGTAYAVMALKACE
ncbi:MAG TPA: prenyltransferase/squalene oxidase repeat-containing protein [Gemmataceae bacterium]|nr:prenyltransferase/squalene oxidase repeat-containing protein [Gemmataceae bacterium]